SKAFFKADVGKGQSLRFRAASSTKCSIWQLIFVRGIALAVGLLCLIPPALATFPGQNGHVAYGALNTTRHYPLGEVFLTDFGQLTFADPSQQFGGEGGWFAWSPMGDQLAFMRTDNSGVDSIQVIGKDGTGLRQVLSAGAIITALPFTPLP